MADFSPFTPIALSAGVIANLATDLLKHYAPATENTLAGRMLKRVGLIDPDFDDRIRDTLSKALQLYFETHPAYQLSGVIAFFGDPAVARQLGGYILNRTPIDQGEIQQALGRHLRGEAVTSILIRRRGLDSAAIIPDFLESYRQVLSRQLSVPHMALLLEMFDQTNALIAEIHASEARLQAFTAGLLERRLSPQALRAAYQVGQQELAGELSEAIDAAGLARPDQAVRIIQARLQPLPMLFANGLCKGRPLRVAADEYFVSHGFDPATLPDWREALAAALAHAGGAGVPLVPYFTGDTLLGGFRLCGICEKLCATRFSVFLLPPSQDRNVYFELGIAIGLRAPLFLIQHHEATIPPVLESLGRYTKGGMFRTMRRELPGQIEEYDFGVVRFATELPAPGSAPAYLLAAGDLVEDEDFEGSVTEAIGAAFSSLKAKPLSGQAGGAGTSGWTLDQLIAAVQTARFGVYRVDEACSPATFLALGISIGLNRPFLMVRKAGRAVPLDIHGIGIYEFPNFVTLKGRLLADHRAFFDKYTR